jgi:hypothetical protein
MNLDKERKECVSDLRNSWICVDAIWHLFKKGKMTDQDFTVRLDAELKKTEIILSDLSKLGM